MPAAGDFDMSTKQGRIWSGVSVTIRLGFPDDVQTKVACGAQPSHLPRRVSRRFKRKSRHWEAELEFCLATVSALHRWFGGAGPIIGVSSRTELLREPLTEGA